MLPAMHSPAAYTFGIGAPSVVSTCARSFTVTPRYVKVIPGRKGYAKNGGVSSGSAQWLLHGVTPAVARSSAGAVEHLPVAVVTNLARYLAEIKGDDLWVAAAAGDSGTPMWQADLSGGLAFVFGAEGKGLRPLVRRTCDLAVSIPQLGQVESLNVSVAAAVLLYEARRQRGG